MAIDDNASYELTGYQVKDLAQKIRAKADSASLASVATSGLYVDIIGAPTIPTVYNGTLTIQQNGTTIGTFSANQSTDTTINLTGGGATYSDFTGATSSSAGTHGLVPAPAIGDKDKFLKGDGTWGDTPMSNGSLEFRVWDDPYGSPQIVGSWNEGTNDSEVVDIYLPSVMTGATSSSVGTSGLVPAPAAGDQGKVLHGDGTWKDTTAKLVEMSYGESNAWAKFISAYNAGSIVYCRASSNSNPATGAQGRKAFMAYVNNATSPTEVEFQYVRSMSSKTVSQQCDQVFVYKLTNASGGTWTVQTRDMGPKIVAGAGMSSTFTNGANATITLNAKAMTGATSSTAGTAGIVPKPAAGDQNKVLKGDGAWIDLAGSYSTTEQKTPFTWIDGKPIYKKTYSMGALINGGGTLVQNISSLDFETVVELRGIAISPTNKNVRPLPLVANGLSDMVRLDVSNNEIHVITTTGSSWSTAYNAYVTIWYTKTTD